MCIGQRHVYDSHLLETTKPVLRSLRILEGVDRQLLSISEKCVEVGLTDLKDHIVTVEISITPNFLDDARKKYFNLCMAASAMFEALKMLVAEGSKEGHIDHGTYSEEVTGECTDECRAVQLAIKKAEGK